MVEERREIVISVVYQKQHYSRREQRLPWSAASESAAKCEISRCAPILTAPTVLSKCGAGRLGSIGEDILGAFFVRLGHNFWVSGHSLFVSSRRQFLHDLEAARPNRAEAVLPSPRSMKMGPRVAQPCEAVGRYGIDFSVKPGTRCRAERCIQSWQVADPSRPMEVFGRGTIMNGPGRSSAEHSSWLS